MTTNHSITETSLITYDEKRKPHVYVISNYEYPGQPPEPTGADELFCTPIRPRGPRCIVTGWAPAVSEEPRAALTDLLAHVPPPERLRDAVALTSREPSVKAKETVSEACVVATLSPDGSGVITVYGNLPKEFLPTMILCGNDLSPSVSDTLKQQDLTDQMLDAVTWPSKNQTLKGVTPMAMSFRPISATRAFRRSLARLAAGRAKRKTTDLEEALRGFFTDRHAVILRMMLDNDDRISGQIAALDAEIEAAIAPFARQAAQLCDLPGIDRVAAAELIGEIGVDMSRFPTPQHLVSWAKFCPRPHESAGKRRSSSRGKGNPWIAGILGRIVFSLSRTDTFLGARYRRLVRRRGKPKALVAVGNSVLIAVWHLLADPDAVFSDLGPSHFESRINAERRARNLATQLEAITGQKILIRGGKAIIADHAA